jgi:hypothetical protein
MPRLWRCVMLQGTNQYGEAGVTPQQLQQGAISVACGQAFTVAIYDPSLLTKLCFTVYLTVECTCSAGVKVWVLVVTLTL